MQLQKTPLIQVQLVNVCKLVFYVLYGENINPVKLHSNTNCSLTPTFFCNLTKLFPVFVHAETVCKLASAGLFLFKRLEKLLCIH